jgi:hypothetical protein
MRPFYLRRGVSAQDAASFYDIDDSFQCWTMNNLDNIIGKRWIDYKVPAKDFIFQYHADVDYRQFKSKEKSRYLDPDLMNKSNLQNYHRLAVHKDFSDYTLSSWPFIDFAEIEDFNDECHLIPGQYL